MFLVSLCFYLCLIHWRHVLSREWRCSWSSADRLCSNYIWVINNLIAYKGATYIIDFKGNSRVNCSLQTYFSIISAYFIMFSEKLTLYSQKVVCLVDITARLQSTVASHYYKRSPKVTQNHIQHIKVKSRTLVTLQWCHISIVVPQITGNLLDYSTVC